MSAQLKIFCTNLGEYIDFQGGETLSDIFARISDRIGFTPICARVNNKTEDLSFPLFAPKMVEYLPVGSPSGRRVYIRSLCMLLYRAVDRCLPGARLVIEHSMSNGYYCRIFNVGDITDSMVEKLTAEMRSLIDRDIPFERKERLRTDVIEIFRRQGLQDKVKLYERIHDVSYKHLTLPTIRLV